MKKYDAYVMGSALVDYEVEITPDDLQNLGVEKGVMTLVDKTRQTELLGQIKGKRHSRAGGGSAANSVVALTQFGGAGFFSCRVADDDAGLFYLEAFKKAGIETNLDESRRPPGQTGKCLVFITPDADRTLNTFLGINGEFSEKDLVEDAMKSSRYLYIEGYLVAFPSGKRAMVEAKKMADRLGVKTALTFSDPNMVKFFGPALEEVAGSGLDLLFCNEAEALEYGKTENLEEAAAKLRGITKAYAITRGAEGALLFDGTSTFEIPGVHTEVRNTNGAGDLFAGAFLYGLTQEWSFVEAGNFACLAAARLVTQFGPRLSNSQAQAVLNDWKASQS